MLSQPFQLPFDWCFGLFPYSYFQPVYIITFTAALIVLFIGQSLSLIGVLRPFTFNVIVYMFKVSLPFYYFLLFSSVLCFPLPLP
jgi:hypothetical protein